MSQLYGNRMRRVEKKEHQEGLIGSIEGQLMMRSMIRFYFSNEEQLDQFSSYVNKSTQLQSMLWFYLPESASTSQKNSNHRQSLQQFGEFPSSSPQKPELLPTNQLQQKKHQLINLQFDLLSENVDNDNQNKRLSGNKDRVMVRVETGFAAMESEEVKGKWLGKGKGPGKVVSREVVYDGVCHRSVAGFVINRERQKLLNLIVLNSNRNKISNIDRDSGNSNNGISNSNNDSNNNNSNNSTNNNNPLPPPTIFSTLHLTRHLTTTLSPQTSPHPPPPHLNLYNQIKTFKQTQFKLQKQKLQQEQKVKELQEEEMKRKEKEEQVMRKKVEQEKVRIQRLVEGEERRQKGLFGDRGEGGETGESQGGVRMLNSFYRKCACCHHGRHGHHQHNHQNPTQPQPSLQKSKSPHTTQHPTNKGHQCSQRLFQLSIKYKNPHSNQKPTKQSDLIKKSQQQKDQDDTKTVLKLNNSRKDKLLRLLDNRRSKQGEEGKQTQGKEGKMGGYEMLLRRFRDRTSQQGSRQQGGQHQGGHESDCPQREHKVKRCYCCSNPSQQPVPGFTFKYLKAKKHPTYHHHPSSHHSQSFHLGKSTPHNSPPHTSSHHSNNHTFGIQSNVVAFRSPLSEQFFDIEERQTLSEYDKEDFQQQFQLFSEELKEKEREGVEEGQSEQWNATVVGKREGKGERVGKEGGEGLEGLNCNVGVVMMRGQGGLIDMDIGNDYQARQYPNQGKQEVGKQSSGKSHQVSSLQTPHNNNTPPTTTTNPQPITHPTSNNPTSPKQQPQQYPTDNPLITPTDTTPSVQRRINGTQQHSDEQQCIGLITKEAHSFQNKVGLYHKEQWSHLGSNKQRGSIIKPKGEDSIISVGKRDNIINNNNKTNTNTTNTNTNNRSITKKGMNSFTNNNNNNNNNPNTTTPALQSTTNPQPPRIQPTPTSTKSTKSRPKITTTSQTKARTQNRLTMNKVEVDDKQEEKEVKEEKEEELNDKEHVEGQTARGQVKLQMKAEGENRVSDSATMKGGVDQQSGVRNSNNSRNNKIITTNTTTNNNDKCLPTKSKPKPKPPLTTTTKQPSPSSRIPVTTTNTKPVPKNHFTPNNHITSNNTNNNRSSIMGTAPTKRLKKQSTKQITKHLRNETTVIMKQQVQSVGESGDGKKGEMSSRRQQEEGDDRRMVGGKGGNTCQRNGVNDGQLVQVHQVDQNNKAHEVIVEADDGEQHPNQSQQQQQVEKEKQIQSSSNNHNNNNNPNTKNSYHPHYHHTQTYPTNQNYNDEVNRFESVTLAQVAQARSNSEQVVQQRGQRGQRGQRIIQVNQTHKEEQVSQSKPVSGNIISSAQRLSQQQAYQQQQEQAEQLIKTRILPQPQPQFPTFDDPSSPRYTTPSTTRFPSDSKQSPVPPPNQQPPANLNNPPTNNKNHSIELSRNDDGAGEPGGEVRRDGAEYGVLEGEGRIMVGNEEERGPEGGGQGGEEAGGDDRDGTVACSETGAKSEIRERDGVVGDNLTGNIAHNTNTANSPLIACSYPQQQHLGSNQQFNQQSQQQLQLQSKQQSQQQLQSLSLVLATSHNHQQTQPDNQIITNPITDCLTTSTQLANHHPAETPLQFHLNQNPDYQAISSSNNNETHSYSQVEKEGSEFGVEKTEGVRVEEDEGSGGDNGKGGEVGERMERQKDKQLIIGEVVMERGEQGQVATAGINENREGANNKTQKDNCQEQKEQHDQQKKQQNSKENYTQKEKNLEVENKQDDVALRNNNNYNTNCNNQLSQWENKQQYQRQSQPQSQSQSQSLSPVSQSHQLPQSLQLQPQPQHLTPTTNPLTPIPYPPTTPPPYQTPSPIIHHHKPQPLQQQTPPPKQPTIFTTANPQPVNNTSMMIDSHKEGLSVGGEKEKQEMENQLEGDRLGQGEVVGDGKKEKTIEEEMKIEEEEEIAREEKMMGQLTEKDQEEQEYQQEQEDGEQSRQQLIPSGQQSQQMSIQQSQSLHHHHKHPNPIPQILNQPSPIPSLNPPPLTPTAQPTPLTLPQTDQITLTTQSINPKVKTQPPTQPRKKQQPTQSTKLQKHEEGIIKSTYKESIVDQPVQSEIRRSIQIQTEEVVLQPYDQSYNNNEQSYYNNEQSYYNNNNQHQTPFSHNNHPLLSSSSHEQQPPQQHQQSSFSRIINPNNNSPNKSSSLWSSTTPNQTTTTSFPYTHSINKQSLPHNRSPNTKKLIVSKLPISVAINQLHSEVSEDNNAHYSQGEYCEQRGLVRGGYQQQDFIPNHSQNVFDPTEQPRVHQVTKQPSRNQATSGVKSKSQQSKPNKSNNKVAPSTGSQKTSVSRQNSAKLTQKKRQQSLSASIQQTGQQPKQQPSIEPIPEVDPFLQLQALFKKKDNQAGNLPSDPSQKIPQSLFQKLAPVLSSSQSPSSFSPSNNLTLQSLFANLNNMGKITQHPAILNQVIRTSDKSVDQSVVVIGGDQKGDKCQEIKDEIPAEVVSAMRYAIRFVSNNKHFGEKFIEEKLLSVKNSQICLFVDQQWKLFSYQKFSYLPQYDLQSLNKPSTSSSTSFKTQQKRQKIIENIILLALEHQFKGEKQKTLDVVKCVELLTGINFKKVKSKDHELTIEEETKLAKKIRSFFGAKGKESIGMTEQPQQIEEKLLLRFDQSHLGVVHGLQTYKSAKSFHQQQQPQQERASSRSKQKHPPSRHQFSSPSQSKKQHILSYTLLNETLHHTQLHTSSLLLTHLTPNIKYQTLQASLLTVNTFQLYLGNCMVVVSDARFRFILYRQVKKDKYEIVKDGRGFVKYGAPKEKMGYLMIVQPVKGGKGKEKDRKDEKSKKKNEKNEKNQKKKIQQLEELQEQPPANRETTKICIRYYFKQLAEDGLLDRLIQCLYIGKGKTHQGGYQNQKNLYLPVEKQQDIHINTFRSPLKSQLNETEM